MQQKNFKNKSECKHFKLSLLFIFESLMKYKSINNDEGFTKANLLKSVLSQIKINRA